MPAKKQAARGGVHQSKTQQQPKSTGVPPFVRGDTKNYNLVLHRYKKGKNTILGVIYEYDTNRIISHTIENRYYVYRKDRPTIKPGLHPITPGGNNWPKVWGWHRGSSMVVADAVAKAKKETGNDFGYGLDVGKENTMMRIDSYNGCLFHPGKNYHYSEGCILIGEKADKNGVRTTWDETQFYPMNIIISTNKNVLWYKTFVNSVINNLKKGKSPRIYIVEYYNDKPGDIA